jgi:hypothetical protein
MSKQIEAMKQALDALEDYEPNEAHKAITALREALTEPEQPPVAEIVADADGYAFIKWHDEEPSFYDNHPIGTKFYTSPQHPRQPLTQAKVVEGFCKQPHDVQFVSVFNAGVRFAEATHGITGDTK